jgi:hypothetical protein
MALDIHGRLDITMDLIVQTMDGHLPPGPEHSQYREYYELLELRLVKQFGPDCLSAPQLLAGFACAEYEYFDRHGRYLT